MLAQDDILLWADGNWCYGDELSQMSHLSDDYQVLVYWTEEWQKFCESIES